MLPRYLLAMTALCLTTGAYAQVVAVPVQPAPATVVIAPNPPPPPQVEVVPPPPSTVMVWQAGYWQWNGASQNWAWVPGSYVQRPTAQAVWHPGQWVPREGGGYSWIEGHWQ
jgi:hypothetical protein